MQDDTATLGQETAESTETQSTESSGQGQVETQGSQGQQDNAGGSQGRSDVGREQRTEPRRQFRSKNQTIYELRQAIRERDAKYQELENRLSQFEQKFSPRQDRKPSRTFWEAPEEVLDERITGHLSEMEKRILDQMHQRDQQMQQTAEWRQETLEANKLIKSELKLTVDEEEELAELLRASPAVRHMSPMERAEYGIFLWNKQKGVTDKTQTKRMAASVSGQTSGASGGAKMWTEKEMEAEMNKLNSIPIDKWTEDQHKRFKELDYEFRLAYKQGRVRK